MKRWRTDGFARRCSLAAALALLIAAIIAGRPSVGYAEQPSPVPASFSQERLQRVSDYIRNEIVTGKIPGAIMLIQQDGKPVLVLEPLNRPITIEDLLRHTSGLTYGFYGDSTVRKLYVNSYLFKDDFDNAEFAERLARLPLAEQPGTLWDYGHSTDVLGRVIEVVSGQSLFQFEKQRLLDPLGMTD